MPGRHSPPGYVSVAHGDSHYEQGPGTPAGSNVQQHWSSGICACFDDIPICCLGCWCPCVLFGGNVQMSEGRLWVGPCMVHLMLWGVATVVGTAATGSPAMGLLASCVPCYACNYRKTICSKYNLEDAPCGDVVTHTCCHLCANCQEYRELVDRTALESSDPDAVLPPSVQSMEAGGSSGISPQDELNDFAK